MAFSEGALNNALATAAKEMDYSELRAKQKTVVKHFLNSRDVLVSLPTGSSKSPCYCIFPHVFDKLRKIESCESCSVVDVRPLIALMEDQVLAVMRGYVCDSHPHRKS